MLLSISALLAGQLLLLWASDRLVEGAGALCAHAGWSPLLVGLVVVGFGSSASALAVAVVAALQGHPGLALGSAWGANIVSMSLVLGVTVLVAPLAAPSPALRRELPLLLAAIVLTALLVGDGLLSRTDAALLLVGFGALLAWSWRQSQRSEADALAAEAARALPQARLPKRQAWRRVGLALLVLAGGSVLLVGSAIDLAQGLGVSDLTLGFTVVALGTTLPSLAICINASAQGDGDIALGHVLGSGLFNTLAVAGLAGLIEPLDVAPVVVFRDLALMAALAAGLYWQGRDPQRPTRLGPRAGRLLVAIYLLHTAALIMGSGPG